MSSKIHHNTLKKAKKFDIELVAVENEFEARKDGKVWGMHASASIALELALTNIEHELNVDPLARVAKATAAIRKMTKTKPARDTIRTRGNKGYSEDELLEDDEELEDEPDEGRSIVKAKYKQEYKQRPLKISCSDDLAVQIATHVKVKDEDGKLRVDGAALKRFAQANSCWDPKYAHLNLGMQRMNVVNRLRGKIRRDKHAVVWSK